MILPEHRLDLYLEKERERQAEINRRPVFDEQRLQEFQKLLEWSFHSGLVIRIVTASRSGPLITTGIVKKISPWAGQLIVQTIEGIRIVLTKHIQEISEL
jgi:hypothetical protein